MREHKKVLKWASGNAITRKNPANEKKQTSPAIQCLHEDKTELSKKSVDGQFKRRIRIFPTSHNAKSKAQKVVVRLG